MTKSGSRNAAGGLKKPCEMRLMSDVPLGMFLSGGVDSSAIAALMKRMVTGPVKTFSVGYSEAEYSELSYARKVSRSIGTEHHEVVVGMDDFFNALPRSHLARRRADHLAVQRFFVLCIASGCAASEGRADRRRQR